MKKIIIFVYLSLFACNYPQSYSEIKPGARLIIHKPLIIYADSASVMLQRGKVINATQLDAYQPRCWFISLQLKDDAQTISRGVFHIKQVRQNYELVQRTRSGHLLAAMASSASLTALDYITEFEITSIDQPDITRLKCGHWEDPDDPEHLTAKQIKSALGEYAEIETN